MNITKVSIDKVIPWDKNPRGIKTKDYERLKKQILKLGIYKPLVAYRENGKYVVLGGNMRIRALKELGIKDVDISIVDAKTEAKKIEYALSDNDRVGFYEEDKLAELVYPHIAELDLAEFKVDLGEAIDLKQVVERYGPDIDDGADEVPEVDDTPAITKPGDLFTLGKHRLLCGDSTKAEDVARLMRGERAALCLTDPPYGVGFKYTTYDDTPDNLRRLVSGFFPLVTAVADVVLLTCGNRNQRIYPEPTWMLCWFVSAGTGMNPWGFSCWQPILAYGKDPYLAHGLGSRPDGIAMTESAPDEKHSCPKPLNFWAWLMERGSVKIGDVVIDPFLGSGTTLIAAEKTGRICYGIEIDQKYCDVIIKRYTDYVGVSEESIRSTRENPNG